MSPLPSAWWQDRQVGDDDFSYTVLPAVASPVSLLMLAMRSAVVGPLAASEESLEEQPPRTARARMGRRCRVICTAQP